MGSRKSIVREPISCKALEGMLAVMEAVRVKVWVRGNYLDFLLHFAKTLKMKILKQNRKAYLQRPCVEASSLWYCCGVGVGPVEGRSHWKSGGGGACSQRGVDSFLFLFPFSSLTMG